MCIFSGGRLVRWSKFSCFTNRVPLFISNALTLSECLSTCPGQRWTRMLLLRNEPATESGANLLKAISDGLLQAGSEMAAYWAGHDHLEEKLVSIDWKVNVSKPAPIHGEHQSPAQWPHTRIFPGQTKLVLQPRSSTQTYNQEPNNIQQTYAKPTFSRSPKPTNDKQPTNQKEWLSAKYTWNALAQVWSAPFEEAPGLQC